LFFEGTICKLFIGDQLGQFNFQTKNLGQFIYDISVSGFLKALKYEKSTSEVNES